jgi:hypothetical protein
LAQEIFRYHVPPGSTAYDKRASGAEWWVQIRPSPPAGRYAVLDNDPTTKNSISFHWDKDEELRLLTDDVLYIHPHLSTVTYLTDVGVATVSLPCLKDSSSGTSAEFKFATTTNIKDTDNQSDIQNGHVSWPKTGKHFKFDGRLLHAAPVDLMPADLLKKQVDACRLPDSSPTLEQKIAVRRKRRVTFLVNIWLNHKPMGVEPFPASMIDKLTPAKQDIPTAPIFTGNTKQDVVSVVDVGELCSKMTLALAGASFCSAPTADNGRNANGDRDQSTPVVVKPFTWALGSCVTKDDSITVQVPLEHIQQNVGRTIEMQWTNTSVAVQHHLPLSLLKGKEKDPAGIVGESQLNNGAEDEDTKDAQNKRPRTN